MKKKQGQIISFKIGDKLVDFGQVYRIFKIEDKKKSKDSRARVIHFKPYYKTNQHKDLVRSIPIKNISLTNIRKPISKNKMAQLLKKLSRQEAKKKPAITAQAQEELRLNKPGITIQVLRRFWLDKQDESTSFTSNKQNLLKLAMQRLVEEVAFVFGIPVAQARKKITRALRRDKKDV